MGLPRAHSQGFQLDLYLSQYFNKGAARCVVPLLFPSYFVDGSESVVPDCESDSGT